MTCAANLLTVQFLAWVAERPRTHAETLEAWRTQCPKYAVWEDANIDGLIAVEGGECKTVTLTPRGRAILAAQPRQGAQAIDGDVIRGMRA